MSGMTHFSNEPVVLIEEVFPQDTNSYGTLFGGRLLSLMDKAAGIVASKFAHREFVTISIDTLKFRRPAHKGDLIEIVAKVVYTSTHTAACGSTDHCGYLEMDKNPSMVDDWGSYWRNPAWSSRPWLSCTSVLGRSLSGRGE